MFKGYCTYWPQNYYFEAEKRKQSSPSAPKSGLKAVFCLKFLKILTIVLLSLTAYLWKCTDFNMTYLTTLQSLLHVIIRKQFLLFCSLYYVLISHAVLQQVKTACRHLCVMNFQTMRVISPRAVVRDSLRGVMCPDKLLSGAKTLVPQGHGSVDDVLSISTYHYKSARTQKQSQSYGRDTHC